MSQHREGINRDQLLAYVDGQLSDAEETVVRAHLRDNPESAAEIAGWQRQNDAIGALYGPVSLEPIQSELDPYRISARVNARSFNGLRAVFAAMILLAIGVGGGFLAASWLNPAPSQSNFLIASAINAHNLYVNERRHSVEVVASDKDHLVSWLSNRLDKQIDAPDLSAEGFTLVGGRLLPPDLYAKSGPAAQLMYENAQSQRLTAYITAASAGDPDMTATTQVSGTNVYYWSNEAINCILVGPLSADKMAEVGKAIYIDLDQLAAAPPPA